MAKVQHSSDSIIGIRGIIKGTLFGLVLSLVLFLIYSMLLSFTSISESTIPMFIHAIVAISVFASGVVAAKITQNMGWLNGLAAGLCYVLILLLLNVLIYDDLTLKSFLTDLLISMVGGCIGGMIGINL